MPPYALPGTEVGPRRARLLGAGAVLLTLAVLIGWRVAPRPQPADEIHVSVLTGHVGEGIGPGTDVRLDGVKVGAVEAIDTAGPGRQRLALTLTRSQLFGLTDNLGVDYAPGNLFGVSALQLHSASGGTVLANGSTVDLTGAAADRVRDATLSALLESTGRLTGDVLTPELAALLVKASHDLTAFTPLLQAVGTTARSFAETQQLPPSLLFDRFGSVLAGLPPMLTGGLTVVDAAYTNKYLATPEHIEKYGDMFNGLQYRLLPTVTRTATVAEGWFGGFIPIVAAILGQLNSSIGATGDSAGRLSDLLDRLHTAFHDTSDGPVLNVDLALVPGLAVPLGAALPAGGR
ncbi:MlaD family protein [Nocardia aurantia]|uniref:Mce/MlaD domain-containing protein n=1 Tax=Nocardia aurantia TaxID=2585199 RepID=A0A7K0DJD7_9NOCA|nr:MlaD family protein [Nocardia aurantia]MQY25923.1 hypothetical protein [Nocardia aurantia]